MASHWCVHLLNGRDLSFNKQCRYIDSKDGVMFFMDDLLYKRKLAAIPISNIMWIESVIEEEENDV